MNPIPWLVPGPLHAVLALLLVLWLARRTRPRLPMWSRAVLLLLTIWTWLSATPLLGNQLVAHLEHRHPPVALEALVRDERAYIVVLASGQMFRPDGQAAPVLDADGWERLRAGIAVWRRVGGRLVFAGGPGQGPHDSFAALMREAALEAGVPEQAILMAAGSRTTYEDLRAVAAVMPSTSSGPRWLVTSALHMPRAIAVSQALALNMHGFPCGFRHLASPTWRAWLPDNGDAALWRDGLHEWLGGWVYRMRGWARYPSNQPGW
jgi:uncharacterized SAM-binding protein YcdF (DUF218 family)